MEQELGIIPYTRKQIQITKRVRYRTQMWLPPGRGSRGVGEVGQENAVFIISLIALLTL